MALFASNGSLTTDKLTINDSDGWDTQAEWEAYQSASDVEIVNGVVQLAEIVAPEGTANYRFEDNSDSSIAIDSWNNYDLAVDGAAYTQQAKVGGYALQFDGNDDGAVNRSFADIGNQFSVLAWVKPLVSTLSDFSILIADGRFGGSREYKFLLQADGNSGIRVNLGDGSNQATIGSISYTEGIWKHIAFTYDGTDLLVYENGSQTESQSVGFNTHASTELFLGYGENASGSPGNYSNIVLDDVKIYSQVIDSQTIDAIYQNES